MAEVPGRAPIEPASAGEYSVTASGKTVAIVRLAVADGPTYLDLHEGSTQGGSCRAGGAHRRHADGGVVERDVEAPMPLDDGGHGPIDARGDGLQRALVRAASTTLAPSRANSRAAAAPIPRLAPITSAILSDNFPSRVTEKA